MGFGPIVGCDRLSMPASFTAEATTERAESPTGLNVNLDVKQTYENAYGLASSTLKRAVVTLPEGMTVNPSAGTGWGVQPGAVSRKEIEISARLSERFDARFGRGARPRR